MVSYNYRKELQEKFEEAFEAHSDSIFRYCYLRISDRERAKELTQDVFSKSWEYALKNSEIENLRSFLYKTAHNLILNEYRDRKRVASLDVMEEEGGFDPVSTDKNPEETATLNEAIALLNYLEPPDKEIMIMRYVDDLPIKDIAEVIGESENSISVRIHRVIKKLKEKNE